MRNWRHISNGVFRKKSLSTSNERAIIHHTVPFAKYRLYLKKKESCDDHLSNSTTAFSPSIRGKQQHQFFSAEEKLKKKRKYVRKQASHRLAIVRRPMQESHRPMKMISVVESGLVPLASMRNAATDAAIDANATSIDEEKKNKRMHFCVHPFRLERRDSKFWKRKPGR